MTNVTFPELCEKLKELDEISLLELLNLSAEDLVDRCEDIIEDKFDELVIKFDWEEVED